MGIPALDHRRFWHWPGGRNLVYAYLVLGPPLFVWFVLVFAGTDWLTGRHGYRVPLYLDRELGIPRLIFSHDLFEHRTKGDLWDRIRGKYLVPKKELRRAKIVLLVRDVHGGTDEGDPLGQRDGHGQPL